MLSRLRDIDVQSHMSDESDYDYINRTPFELDHFLDLSSDESLEPAYPSSSDIDPERPDMTRRPVMTFGDPRLGEPDQPRTLTGDEDIDDINAFLDDEIPQRFINYYQTAYKRTYPECCDEDTDAPWDHIDPEDPNDLEELYSRFVHFLTWLLETMYNEHCGSTDANAGMLEDWMDLSFQMAKHEIQKAGKNILPLIRDDVWENYKCLYMRLDDWVQQQIVEHDLWQSPHPSPRRVSEDSGFAGEE